MLSRYFFLLELTKTITFELVFINTQMKKIIIAKLLLFIALCTSAQNVHVFEKNGQYGLKDTKDKIILKPSFDYIYPLQEKSFLVEKNKKIGVVSDNGSIVLNPIFDDVKNLNTGDFIVSDNGKWGVLTTAQRIILPLEYTGIDQLSDYLYVINRGNKKGIMDKLGKVIQPANCDDISSISDFMYLLKNGNTSTIIDNLGNIIMTGSFNSFEKIPVGNLYKVGLNGKFGVVDLDGKVSANADYDDIDYSNPSYIILKRGEKYGFIVNKMLIPATYDKIMFVQNDLGVIGLRQGRLNGFLTTAGLLIPPIYENMSRFSSNGHAVVERRGKLMYVDITGKERTLQEVSGNVRF